MGLSLSFNCEKKRARARAPARARWQFFSGTGTGTFCYFLIFLFLFSNTVSGAESFTPHRILFLNQSGNLEKALQVYRDYVKNLGHHDYDLLQQIGLQIIEQGYRSDESEEKIMAAFGAGIAFNEKALYLLEEGLKSPNPHLQLVCLNFLSQYQNDDADEALNRALSSNYLLIRLEGAYHLAKRKSSFAVAQAEALMQKVDTELWPLFPQIFAAAGTANAISILRKLMTHGNDFVRLSSLICAADNGRDDLLPSIRMLSTHPVQAQQEACAYAFGVLKDESSIPFLKKMSESDSNHLRIAAYRALFHLGITEVREKVETEAVEGDIFAISLLKEFPGSEEVLCKICQQGTIQAKTNAAISLLVLKDFRCLPIIASLLLRDSRDLALVPQHSKGKTLMAFKVVPSAQQNFSSNPELAEIALRVKEQIVEYALELPEEHFIRLANLLLEARQSELVPTIISGLTQIRSQQSIALLKKHQQKVGAPLIRNYCSLALYKLQEEGPYASQLKNWVASQHQNDLIEMRPMLGRDGSGKEQDSPHQLSLKETSRLLVETFSAFTESQDETGIDILLEAIEKGNPKNRFALAGLLVHFN